MTPGDATATVLLVDDDDAYRQVMAREIGRRGYSVETAATGQEALDAAGRVEVDVVLLDMRLPDLSGIEVLKRLRAMDVAAGVIVVTGHGTIDTAIQAIRLGADDFLEKPCPIEKVEMAVRKTCEHKRLVARHAVLQDGYAARDSRAEMVGESPAFRELLSVAERIARTDSTALILGETGVGKELVARLLHLDSPRREASFVIVDCAALHEDLLLSELFGHEKGSFSGATRRKHGLFEVASGGTLFLDEVGEASPEIQAKLLRVLETGCFRRVGGDKEVVVNVRVVSATNRDLEGEISAGAFREDLFFRLSTLTIRVPPLRERSADVPLLVEHFCRRFERRFGRPCRVSAEAMEVLGLYAWPGNVRELLHVLEQAVVLSDSGVLLAADLPEHVRAAPGPASDELPARDEVQVDALPSLRELERRHVTDVLARVRGNRSHAAEVLGISERNLYRLIKRYAEEPGPTREGPRSPRAT